MPGYAATLVTSPFFPALVEGIRLKLVFLGTAASEGYPNAFCDCENCARARELGGPSLRKRCSVVIDGELLIDLSPDVMAAAQVLGLSLGKLRYGLQTHEHSDHLDPSHFGSRSPMCGVHAPRLAYYASQDALNHIAAARGQGRLPATGLADSEVAHRLNLEVHAIGPCQTFTTGPYRVSTVPASHAPGMVPMLFAIERDGRRLFYGTDTGPIPGAAWHYLAEQQWQFDVIVLDHTFGTSEGSANHLNAEQFRDQVARFRADGLMANDARVFAHHIAHHSNPSHPELAEFAASHGYEVAYDGLAVEV